MIKYVQCKKKPYEAFTTRGRRSAEMLRPTNLFYGQKGGEKEAQKGL